MQCHWAEREGAGHSSRVLYVQLSVYRPLDRHIHDLHNRVLLGDCARLSALIQHLMAPLDSVQL